MERIEQKTITLYLTSWQKRMIMDHMQEHIERLGIIHPYDNLNKIRLGMLDNIHIVTYRVPEPYGKAFNLYLTDEQIRQVAEMAGVKTEFSALQISPEMLEEKSVIFE